MNDSEMMKNEISLSDIRISTDKNPWKFSNLSYRKFFKFYKFHFPWMQFFICTITMRFIHCWETAFWNTQWCSSPFAFLFKNLLHVSNSVILLNVWLKKTKNHFFLFSFSKHKFLSNLTRTPLVFVNSIKKVLTLVDIFTMLLFLPKHLSLYEWSP